MTATTTIRVPRTTRDELAAMAKRRGVSVSQLLTEQVMQWHREEWFAEERARSQITAAAIAEQDLWESTDDDWD